MSPHRDLSPSLEQLAASEPAAAAMRSLPASEPDAVFFHFDLLRSLRLYRSLVCAILALGIALAIAYIAKTWPIYTAECLVYIQPAPPRLLASGPNQSWPYDENTYESFMQQQVNNATRSDVLLSAFHKLPAGSWQRPGESEQAAVERLARAIKVERIGSSYQISVAARASRATFAAQIANAVASSFVEIAKADLRAGDPQRIRLLGEERERIEKALNDDRAEQENLNKTLGVAAVYNTTDPYDAQITALRMELARARAASDEASARLTTFGTDTVSSAALDAEADELIAADAGLVSMKTSLNQRRALLISQMANLTPNHPQYKQNADELAKINASLETTTRDLRAKAAAHIQQRMKNDLERTSTLEARLNAQLGRLAGAAGSASPRMQRSNDLATDIQRLQNRFTAVDEQYRNLAMENKAPGAASLSAAAVPPLHASTSRLLRNVMIVLIASVILAIFAAVAAHNLDPRIYITTDVERVLGFSPMAQLPDFHEVSSGVGEEYMLRLAAAMEHSYQQGGFKSCIVTGAGPGAGTTTVANRVSSMLEGMGRSTVLVDASGTPPPSNEENAETTTGLVTTRQESRPSALLQQMADEMDSDTIVLTDTAPLLASGETEYLARFVDSAIVIIQSGLTTRAQLREVAQTLQRLEVSAAGFVLNRVSIEKANPSFRQSVRAVEKRLALQSRLHPRHASHPRPSARHAHKTDQEPSFVPIPEPVKPPVAATAPKPSPEPVAPVRPAAPLHAERTTDPVPVAAAVEPTPSRAPNSARGRGEPHRTTPAPQMQVKPPAPAPTASVATSVAPPPPVVPQPASAPPVSGEAKTAPRPKQAAAASAAIPPFREAKPEPAPPVSRPAEQRMPPPVMPAPPAPVAPSPQPPAIPWEAAPDDRISEREDSGYAAASRLGGLRNLLVTLGRKSLTNVDHDSDLEPRFEKATVRPAYPEGHPAAETSSENAAPVQLTAPPEFLPPKPMAEVEKEKETVRPTPPASPRDRWDSQEEIQTLPSWRGQYRKKKYPPI